MSPLKGVGLALPFRQKHLLIIYPAKAASLMCVCVCARAQAQLLELHQLRSFFNWHQFHSFSSLQHQFRSFFSWYQFHSFSSLHQFRSFSLLWWKLLA